MSQRVLILVEGQTEERFVRDVMAPAFLDKGVYFTPTILVTKRLKDGTAFKGGVTSYTNFRRDALNLFQSAKQALVTTMLDYYGLPEDFPGMSSRSAEDSAVKRAIHVEKAIAEDFNSPKNFIPFLALHEFEALLFSSTTELPAVLSQIDKQPQIEAIRSSFKTPEAINDRPDFAPSKRIQKLFPDYNKVLHGSTIAKRIGLEKIRVECPHFNDWLSKIETYVAA